MTEAAAPAQVDQANIDQIVAKYVEFRDALDRKQKALDAELAPMKAGMVTIENYLMDLANKTGQTKFGTPSGTAFITTKTGCNVADWDVVKKFVLDNNAWNLLNKAVNKTAVGEYMDANNQQTPPGVNWTTMKAIQIRRA